MKKKLDKILAIDDDKALLKLVCDVLEDDGYKVIKALDGRTGIDKAKKFSPSLIILDLEMPHYSGTDTIKALKRIDKTKNIPVLFLTGNSNILNIKKAMYAGAVDYIVKPFDIEDFISRVNKYALEPEDYNSRYLKN